MSLIKKTSFIALSLYGLSLVSCTPFVAIFSAYLQPASIEKQAVLTEEISIEDLNLLLQLAATKEVKIAHKDITGFKSIVLNKRKRQERRRNRQDNNNSRPQLAAAKAPAASLKVTYQELFDSLSANQIRTQILTEAKRHLGLKYRWGGTTPKGFDCSGFTSYVLAKGGVNVARTSRYQAKQGQSKDFTNVKTGDLIFFSKYGKGGRVTHVAMVVAKKEDGIYVIHATRRGIVVDNLAESSYWKPKMLYAKDVITKG